MKMRIQVVLIAIGVLAVATSCSDDPAAKGVKLEMKATSTLSTISNSGGRVRADNLTFTEIKVGVRELEFETEAEDGLEDSQGEDPSDEIEFEGPYVVDLINGTSTPDFGMGNLQPGTYDKMEIEMGPVLDDGSTVRIGFTWNSTAVEFSTTEEIELEIEHAAGYQLDASSLNNVLVLLNLDSLFSTVDLSLAVADPDGVIRINDSTNSELAHQILALLEESCDAGEDNDHDDDID